MVDFGVVLSGGIRHRIRNRAYPSTDLDNREGCGGILYLPQSEIRVDIPARERHRILHVHVSVPTLREILGDELGTLARPIRHVLEERPGARLLRHGRIEPATLIAAHQLLNLPENGPQRLFLEAKALEIIALQIGWADAGSRAPEGGIRLTPSDRERIREARDRLVGNLEIPPPTLTELSRELGISANRLEAGFRTCFGNSVFGYYREFRMQTAFRLLEDGDRNVSEVAWSVGYTNVSHFGAAYRKRFGILPGTHRARLRRKAVFPLEEGCAISPNSP